MEAGPSFALEESEGSPLPPVTTKSFRCLICGGVSTVVCNSEGKRVRVKRETFGGTDNNGVGDVELGMEGMSADWEASLLECFFKTVALDKGEGFEWNLELEPMPFCAACESGHLAPLKGLLDELKKIKSLISKSVKEVKEKMKGAEGSFQSGGVYKEDERYYWVRANIIGKARVGRAPRRSKRGASSGSNSVPVVVISNSEKEAAEKATIMKDDSLLDDFNNMLTEWSPPASPIPDDTSADFEHEKSFLFDGYDEPSQKLKTETETPGKRKSLLRMSKSKKKQERTLNKGESKGPVSDSKDSQSLPSSSKLRRKKSRSKGTEEDEDNDFLPSSSHEESEEEEEEDEEADADYEHEDFGVKRKKGTPGRKPRNVVRFNKVTGVASFYDVDFERFEESSFKCMKCGSVVYSHSHIRSHTYRVHTDKFRCPHPDCNYRASGSGNLSHHVKAVHEKSNVSKYQKDCDICGKPFGRKNLLPKHRLTHYSTEELQSAKEKGELEFLNNRQADFVCQHCGRAFSRRYRLSNHEQLVHSKQGSNTNEDGDNWTLEQDAKKKKKKEKFICDLCGKSFANRNSLDSHHRAKHADKSVFMMLPYACTMCNKRFVKQIQLKKHQIIHQANRPFPCKLCPRQFSNESGLKQHMDMHNNIRNYKCEHCELSFVRPSHLKSHYNNYHAPGSTPKRKPFIRGPDKGQFRLNSTLTNQHFGDKERLTEFQQLPRQCPHCVRSFQYPSQLNNHIQRHHNPDKRSAKEMTCMETESENVDDILSNLSTS